MRGSAYSALRVEVKHLFSKLKSKFSSAAPSGPVEVLVVGLGNPGREYEGTRHNAGFLALDRLAKEAGARVDRLKFKSLCGDAVLGGKRALLMKPNTFMNNSGEAVAEAMRFYKIPLARVVVLCDDVNLDVGRVRIRRAGSAGGHNGLKSIIALCGGDGFSRVRIGVGKKPHPEYDLATWVLGRFPEGERAALDDACGRAAEAAGLIAEGKIDLAMNKYSS